MDVTITPIRDDAHWHELRSKHVGGSDIAALFDASPYMTAFTLWHSKAGNVAEKDHGNDRTEWGKRLEPAIAAGISDQMRWSLEKCHNYHHHDKVKGLGCTLDYYVIDHADGPGLLEVKFMAEYRKFKEEWSDKRAPVGIELQVQHQLACTGFAWGAIGLFIGQSASLQIYERKRDEKVIAAIEKNVGDFWDSIAKKEAPDINGTPQEWEVLRELHPVIERDKIIEMPDSRLSDIASMYEYADSQRYSGGKEHDRCKTLLRGAMGSADCMLLPGWRVRQRKHGKGIVITVEEADTGLTHQMPDTSVELA